MLCQSIDIGNLRSVIKRCPIFFTLYAVSRSCKATRWRYNACDSWLEWWSCFTADAHHHHMAVMCQSQRNISYNNTYVVHASWCNPEKYTYQCHNWLPVLLPVFIWPYDIFFMTECITLRYTIANLHNKWKYPTCAYCWPLSSNIHIAVCYHIGDNTGQNCVGERNNIIWCVRTYMHFIPLLCKWCNVASPYRSKVLIVTLFLHIRSVATMLLLYW